jgi:peptidoglycan/xylan/chitin deacetylase (PgdA/CDA1 family)
MNVTQPEPDTLPLMQSRTKIAYLTIDDSPSRFMRHKVDYLLSRGIPAIFYVRGEFVEQNKVIFLKNLSYYLFFFIFVLYATSLV